MVSTIKHRRLPIEDAVLEKNPKIAKSAVDRYLILEDKLRQAGVDIKKPHYNMAHPFERIHLKSD